MVHIKWSVKDQKYEVVGFARVDHDDREIDGTVTVEISAHNIGVIVLDRLPNTAISGAHLFDIFIARAVAVIREAVTRMIVEPCGDHAFLPRIQGVTCKNAGRSKRQERSHDNPE